MSKMNLAQTVRNAKQQSGQNPHVVVEALAGTGKTFTLIVGLAKMAGGRVWKQTIKHFGFEPEPSPQQEAVWDQLAAGRDSSRSIRYVAFNKSIVEDFGRKYKWMVEALNRQDYRLRFSTTHGLGFGVVLNNYDLDKKEPIDPYRTRTLLEIETGKSWKELTKTGRGETLAKGVDRLVEQCKLNLCEPTETNLTHLAEYYDIELDGMRDRAFELTERLLIASRVVDKQIGYSDMIWIPTVNELQMKPSALLLGDEAQDWNRCQQAIIKRAGVRLMVCGDSNQSIYGWAGADVDSIPRLRTELGETSRGVQVLPLTVTRRCGKQIVEIAKEDVPEFEAHADNPEGEITDCNFAEFLAQCKEIARGEGNECLVLSRVNAPLVSACFRLIRNRIPATIKGRNIGTDLINLVDSFQAADAEDLVESVELWYGREIAKIEKAKFPSDDKKIAVQDKRDCVLVFTEGASTIKDVKRNIKSVFSDDVKEGSIVLSSIHRAKGLEADTVFIIRPELIPHPKAESVWAVEQEYNLRYVAYTRAIKTLCFVCDEAV